MIATRIAGISELIEHGVTGVLVNPGRADLLSDAVERLLLNPRATERMAFAASEKVRREFNLNTVAAQLAAIFHKTLPDTATAKFSGKSLRISSPTSFIAQVHPSAGRCQPMIVALFVLLFAPLLIWWTLWLLFAILAAFPVTATSADPGQENSFQIGILIPAHDEELLLPQLLATLDQQTIKAHRTLVIADHCSDQTAAIARQHRASVLERTTGPQRRQTEAALRDGLQWLNETASPSPTPRAILILDADCTVSSNLIAETLCALQHGAKVVQAAYVLDSTNAAARACTAPPPSHSHSRILPRPAGITARLGLPTQLFGTGMCFRQEVLAKISFHDHLTEDLAMSHDLLLCGIQPKFLRNAMVRSPLPQDRGAMTTQKLRWETGQLMTWTALPRMLSRLVVRAQFRSALALIDWSAPPLALAIIYWLGAYLCYSCPRRTRRRPNVGVPAAAVHVRLHHGIRDHRRRASRRDIRSREALPCRTAIRLLESDALRKYAHGKRRQDVAANAARCKELVEPEVGSTVSSEVVPQQ